MATIYGYDKQKEYIKNALAKNSLSHFYIVSGETGCGKKELVNHFVKTILCDSKDACGRCMACMKSDSGNSVDVIKVEATNKKTIGSKDIRTLLDDLYVRPVEGEYKIYIIDEGERLTTEASNTLLKALEEPPDYAVFFLLTSNKEKLLDTVISRGTEIYLPPLNDNIVESYIRKELKIFDDEKIEFLLNYSAGNIGVVKDLSLDDKFFYLREEVLKLFEQVADKDARCLQGIKVLFDDNKTFSDEILKIMLSVARDVVYFRVVKESDNLINTDKVYLIKSLSEKIYSAIRLYDDILDSIKLKDRNVNVIMTVKVAFMNALSEE